MTRVPVVFFDGTPAGEAEVTATPTGLYVDMRVAPSHTRHVADQLDGLTVSLRPHATYETDTDLFRAVADGQAFETETLGGSGKLSLRGSGTVLGVVAVVLSVTALVLTLAA